VLQRTEGIVLRTFPYGEADLMVTYLTLDSGLRKAFAKSPRKMKSRFGSSLEPFTYSRVAFMGREDASLPRLTQSDIIRPFQSLRDDMDCLLRLSGMAELTIGFLEEGVRSKEAFILFRRVLEMMEAAGCSGLFGLFYKVRFLGLKGYLPGLAGCARCGKPGQRFYVSHGSVICGVCAMRAGLPDEGEGVLGLSKGSASLFKALNEWDIENLSRIKASPAMAAELEGLINAHVEYIISRPLRTVSFTGASNRP
jgi:DNA repair protein RecO (recombination protein O)